MSTKHIVLMGSSKIWCASKFNPVPIVSSKYYQAPEEVVCNICIGRETTKWIISIDINPSIFWIFMLTLTSPNLTADVTLKDCILPVKIICLYHGIREQNECTLPLSWKTLCNLKLIGTSFKTECPFYLLKWERKFDNIFGASTKENHNTFSTKKLGTE